MIAISHLLENPSIYKQNLIDRGSDPTFVDEILEIQPIYKSKQQELDNLRQEKNEFNKLIVSLPQAEKVAKIEDMKTVSENIKVLENEVKELKENLDNLILKIPTLLSSQTPVGKDDNDNPELKKYGTKPTFNFEPKAYYELPVYNQFVSGEDGVKVMGSRGYYLHGDIALFQKVLFDYALEIVLKHGLELFYVPLMLNDKVLTGTGHIPDFDGQQYKVEVGENKNHYLISSSEPSIMGYFMDKNFGEIQKPILATCWSTCFRQEAGSYGKDQQGILRVHQFEKVEMVALGTETQMLEMFDKFNLIVEEIYSGLGIHYRAVEVCSGDMPSKHTRQIDYEAWFPNANKYREICSSGNASDYQNRGLRISYKDENGNNQTPHGLNCTAITFRTGLAILEQFQQTDGSVKLPAVLASKMGKEYLE